MCQVWLAKDPIMFMLGGDFMSYCTYKQAFIRIPDVPDDLSEQLDASLLALDGVEKGTGPHSVMSCPCLSSTRSISCQQHSASLLSSAQVLMYQAIPSGLALN